MAVFVLDKNKQPLMPCSEKRARKLLTAKRAAVWRMYPFTIILKDREGGATQPLELKIDPGSRYTGLAVVRKSEKVDTTTGEVKTLLTICALFQLNHRGTAISEALKSRAMHRRQRRARFTRYREARFNNRPKPKGWLAPSLMHRVHTCIAWVRKLQRLCPISLITQELVRFDMQKMETSNISGVEYQQGELAGYEVKEYLLEKWGRQCAYCKVKNVPLQIEHIHPKSKGGSNRVSNLTLACKACNQAKGSLPIKQYLKNKPELLKRILNQVKAPLKDAAAVNATRWKLYNSLKETGLPIQVASGGRTKWNRIKLGIPKEHALDAACVGHVDELLRWKVPTLIVQCAGRGVYSRTSSDKYGFPRLIKSRRKIIHGFQTGDICKASVPKGRYQGTWIGRISTRERGSFNLIHMGIVLDGISCKHMQVVQKQDGYGYSLKNRLINFDSGALMLDVRKLRACLVRAGIAKGELDEVSLRICGSHIELSREQVEEHDAIVAELAKRLNRPRVEIARLMTEARTTLPTVLITRAEPIEIKDLGAGIVRIKLAAQEEMNDLPKQKAA